MADVNLLPSPDVNLTGMNFTQEEYVEVMLGSKRLPMAIVLPVTFVYVAIFVTGVFGNVATCLVIIRNPVMQTATNYYLFSLAVSDLTLLLLGKCEFPSSPQLLRISHSIFRLDIFARDHQTLRIVESNSLPFFAMTFFFQLDYPKGHIIFEDPRRI